MMPLAGKRILLIGIGFYDYESAIADEFRRLGAHVRVEDERPPAERGRLAPIKRRLLPRLEGPRARHRGALLARLRASEPLDYILVIKGELLTDDFLRAVRDAHPTAKLISYQWDSMARFPDLVQRQSMFDRVLTFDQADAARYPGFILRPTFFRPELLAAKPLPPLVDLCFVGWLHHARLAQIASLRAQAAALGLSSFFYLFTGWKTGIELMIKGSGRDVHMRPMPFGTYAGHIAACSVIVDLPHPMQTGLTMRALEAIGTGKKLLTTARDISRYDFYRPENISVIDAATPRLEAGFFLNAPAALPPTTVATYSLRRWALDVLGIAEPASFLRE